jgi:hypothetical protein
MTIIEFYKKLSTLLTDAREKFISHTQAEKKLEELIEQAQDSKLDVKVSKNILDPINLMRLDDEKSFREEEDDDYYSDDSSYDYENSF